MHHVQILMSTYNGETYLLQQIESILDQNEVNVSLLIRDDGSSDKSREIIDQISSKNSNIELIRGENIGYKRSFLELLNSSGEFDYYAFADQDDVWLSNKLIEAIKVIESENSPCMYHSNCMLVDENLYEIGLLHKLKKFNNIKDEQALVQGFAHGCTMVFNNHSCKLLRKFKSRQAVAHDHWIPLLFCLLGVVKYDTRSFIKYRQHNSNVFGADKSLFKVLKNRLNQYTEQPKLYSNLLRDILTSYSNDLPVENKDILVKILQLNSTFIGRIRLAMNNKLKRNYLKGTIMLKFTILSGNF